MDLKIKSKTIKLIVKTRKIIAIARELEDNKFEEGFFTAVRDCNIELLPIIIKILAETEDSKEPFETIDEVYDFLDDYMKESKKTYADIYMDVAKEINEKGFFSLKMTQEQLESKVNDVLLSVNYEGVMKDAIEKMATQIAEEEFKGYKG
jgi:DNA-binding ferritin-like protein (Dps family)